MEPTATTSPKGDFTAVWSGIDAKTDLMALKACLWRQRPSQEVGVSSAHSSMETTEAFALQEPNTHVIKVTTPAMASYGKFAIPTKKVTHVLLAFS